MPVYDPCCCHFEERFKWNQHDAINLCCKTMLVYIIGQSYRCTWRRQRGFFQELQLRLPFPVPNLVQRDFCHALCHWEVKAGRIRKGQERGSQLQGNKGKPIPLGMILTLETQESADSGSMGSSGGRKEGGGDQDRILHQGKCASLYQNYPPEVAGDPVTCSDVSLNTRPPHPPSFWLTACAKPRGWTCGTHCCKLINNCEFFFPLWSPWYTHSAPLFPPQVEPGGSWLSLSDNSWLK